VHINILLSLTVSGTEYIRQVVGYNLTVTASLCSVPVWNQDFTGNLHPLDHACPDYLPIMALAQPSQTVIFKGQSRLTTLF
jgi:hypothetical protein